MLDLETASVTALKLEVRERTEVAVAVEAERIFQIGATGIGGTALVVGNSDFFPALMRRIA